MVGAVGLWLGRQGVMEVVWMLCVLEWSTDDWRGSLWLVDYCGTIVAIFQKFPEFNIVCGEVLSVSIVNSLRVFPI